VAVSTSGTFTTTPTDGAHSLALKADGTVWAWGRNNRGQLGNGTVTIEFPPQDVVDNNRNTPTQVQGLENAIDIIAGDGYSLAIREDGTIWTWGLNSSGQLGDNTFVNKSLPIQVIEFTDAISISAGTKHSMAVKSDGSVWGWGGNCGGKIGSGINAGGFRTPVQTLGVGGEGFLNLDICIACTGVCGEECTHQNCDKFYFCGVCEECDPCEGCFGECGIVCQHPGCKEIYICEEETCPNCNPCTDCTGTCGEICMHQNCDKTYICGKSTCALCTCLKCFGICNITCHHKSCNKVYYCGICVSCNPCKSCKGVCGKTCIHLNCNKIFRCRTCKTCKPEPPISPVEVGYVLGGKTIGIGDALEIFKFLAGMNNVIEDEGKGSRAWRAALITGGGTPGIADALEIFKKLAGMNSFLDGGK